jgi:hypothetical protein
LIEDALDIFNQSELSRERVVESKGHRDGVQDRSQIIQGPLR